MLHDLVYPMVLGLVALLSLLAILHPAYDDNIIQRVGLAGTCFGAVVRAATWLGGQDLEGPRDMITYGVFVYGLGTLWSYYWGRKRHADRRMPRDCPFWEEFK